MKIHYYYQSNIGNSRENNEDNMYVNGIIRPVGEKIFEQEGTTAFINSTFGVFDGMGGESCGEQASLIAAETLKETVKVGRINTSVFFQKANELICDYTVSANLSRCGTTAALLQFDKGFVQASNIGDSRIYHFHEGKLIQLTHDHTEYQQKIDIVDEIEKTNISPSLKNVLTQFLGLFPDEMIIEPYYSEKATAQAGDIFMLCSDGLYGKLSNEYMEQQFGSIENISELGKKLLSTALDRKEKDNITVVIIEVISEKLNYNEIILETLNQWKMKLKKY